MKPTRLLSRGGLAALALAWLALVAGCGPGVGGTGTGRDDPGAPSSTLAALCDSGLTPLLRCPSSPGTAVALGTSLVWLADGAASRDVLARVEGNAIDLELGCRGLQFSGSWSLVSGQAPRFVGQVRDLSSGATAAASLTAQLSGATLLLQLFDAQGASLAGPVTLAVVATPPPLGICR